jgi:peptide/nickel transport system substrate-binding protein
MLIPTSGRPTRFLALTLLATLAAGCGGRDGSAARPAASPRRGGTAVVGWNGDMQTVNELLVASNYVTTEILMRMFLRLVEEKPDYAKGPPTFAPQLARSWDWSPDHRTLTLHLQPEARWSDGVPVTADDVLFTWQAQTSPDIAWDSVDMKRGIAGVDVVDPKTVRFRFSHAYAKQMLDVNEGVILPKHAWEKLPFPEWRKRADWFRDHLVVDGPFTLESWQPHQQVVLKRNEHYFEPGFPRLDRVVMRVILDQPSLMTQLFNGELDFVPQVAPADAVRVKADPHLELLAYWFRLSVVVAWNNRSPLFSDPEVRRALTLAVDRQTIVDTLWGQYARVADSPIVQAVAWAHDARLKPWPYDPAEARRILAAKGFRDSDGDGILDRGGRPFAFELLSNAGNQQRNDAAVMIQEQLKKVGIKVTPRILEFGTLVELTNHGKAEASIEGFGMDTSLDLTGYFHTPRLDGDSRNLARYANPEVDRLIDQSMAFSDIADAKPTLDRIQEILHRDQPYTFLWESQRMPAINRRLHEVKPNMLFALTNMKEWWIEPRS